MCRPPPSWALPPPSRVHHRPLASRVISGAQQPPSRPAAALTRPPPSLVLSNPARSVVPTGTLARTLQPRACTLAPLSHHIHPHPPHRRLHAPGSPSLAPSSRTRAPSSHTRSLWRPTAALSACRRPHKPHSRPHAPCAALASRRWPRTPARCPSSAVTRPLVAVSSPRVSTTPSLVPSRTAAPAARRPRHTLPLHRRATPLRRHLAPTCAHHAPLAPPPPSCAPAALVRPHAPPPLASRAQGRPHLPLFAVACLSAAFVRPHAPPCALAHAPSAVVTRPSAAQRPRPPPPCSGQALPSLRAALARPSDTASCLLDPCRGPSDRYAPHRHQRCLVHPYHPHTPSRSRPAPPRASVPPQHKLTAPSRAPTSPPRNWWHCLIARGPTSPSDALALPLCMPALWPCVPVPPFRTSAPPSQFLNADGHERACAEKTHKWSIREVEHSTEVFIGKSCFHLPMFSPTHPPPPHACTRPLRARMPPSCACVPATLHPLLLPPSRTSAALAYPCRPGISTRRPSAAAPCQRVAISRPRTVISRSYVAVMHSYVAVSCPYAAFAHLCCPRVTPPPSHIHVQSLGCRSTLCPRRCVPRLCRPHILHLRAAVSWPAPSSHTPAPPSHALAAPSRAVRHRSVTHGPAPQHPLGTISRLTHAAWCRSRRCPRLPPSYPLAPPSPAFV
ncbi:hypothetical protein DENSPDRAFT_886707 [Dentipellis sp. KUC8613]|nr:hypothetical protein DENSPDRAFT_886707 [Dentipellis sp. KUC8613]